MKKFTTGQQVFDIYGQSYNYLSAATMGHAVEAVYEDDEGPHYSEPTWLREVFAEPPRQRLAADLSDLQAEIAAKSAELAELRREVYAADADKRAVIAAAQREPQLADLALWLQGKATHILSLDHYHVQIGTVDEILRSPDRDRTLRLLSLYVDPKELRYGVRRAAYSDGSGSQTICRLASSEEHAKELAREYIAEKLKHPDSQWSANTWTQIAIVYGVPVSEQRIAALKQEERKRLDERLVNARSAHERATQELAQAQAEASQP